MSSAAALTRVPLYTVQRTAPSYCPRCLHPLKTDEKDYGWIIGWIDEGRKRPHSHRIIQCNTCKNETFQQVMEEWCVLKKSDADALVRTGEYWNLREGTASGPMACDRRTFYDVSQHSRGYLVSPQFAGDGSLVPTANDSSDQTTLRMLAAIGGRGELVREPTPAEIARKDAARALSTDGS